MTLSLLFLGLVVPISSQRSIDQTGDVAIVASYLAALKNNSGSSQQLLSDKVVTLDSFSQRPRALAEFQSYAAECRLEGVKATLGSQRLPIQAKWYCDRMKRDGDKIVADERHASFWIENGRIAKISWGEPFVVRIPPLSNSPLRGAN